MLVVPLCGLALAHLALSARLQAPSHHGEAPQAAAAAGGRLAEAARAASLVEASASSEFGPSHAVAGVLTAAFLPGGVPPPLPPPPPPNVVIEQQAPARAPDFYSTQQREKMLSEKALLRQSSPSFSDFRKETPILLDEAQPPTKAAAPEVVALKGRPSGAGCGGCGGNGVCFGTWNIQNLGVSKESRPAVVAAIREVLSRYDVAVIQELSQKPQAPYECGPNTESVICSVRPGEREFEVAASPRIGDEQYAMMARDGSVVISERSETYPDPNNIHARPPHAFEVTVKKGPSDWRLALGVTHTSPKQATDEILNFPNVLQWMEDTFGQSDGSSTPGGRGSSTHYLLAGDYNADGSYFKENKQWGDSHLGGEFKGFTLLTGNDLDSTVAPSSNSYDRVIVDDALAKKSGKGEVFRLEDVDLSGVRKEGCKMGYVKNKQLCTAEYEEMPWSQYPEASKLELAKQLSDHHPVEMCLRDD